MIMQAVGVAEDNIFKKRKEDDVRFLQFHPVIIRILAYKDTKALYQASEYWTPKYQT